MHSMTDEDLCQRIESHGRWLKDPVAGEFLWLREVSIQVFPRDADLRRSRFDRCSFESALFRGADLTDARFSGCHMFGADLTDTILRGTMFVDTPLLGANLECAVTDSTTSFTPYQIVPDTGEFVGWKKVRIWGGCCDEGIVRLKIPADASRVSTPVGRKCRASKALVLVITCLGHGKPHPYGTSMWDPDFVYEVGEIAIPHDFDPDFRVECSRGIHFFVTKSEAREYEM